MSGIGATALAKPILLAYFQAQVPLVLPGVNADFPDTTLDDFASYLDYDPTFEPQTPALIILPDGFSNLSEEPGYMENAHDFGVTVAVGDSDPQRLQNTLERYVTALVRCVGRLRTGDASLTQGGGNLYWPVGQKAATYGQLIKGSSGFYRECSLSLGLILGENA